MIIESANKKQKEKECSILWFINVKCLNCLHQKISASLCQMRKRFCDMKDSTEKHRENSDSVYQESWKIIYNVCFKSCFCWYL